MSLRPGTSSRTTCLLRNGIAHTQLKQFQQSQLTHLTYATSTPSPSFQPSYAACQRQTSFSKPVTRLYSTNNNNGTNTNHNPAKKSNPKPQSSKIEPPVFDFKSLGLKGPVKIVVIAVISVLGTIETVFWVKVGWRWWKGESQGGEGEEDGQESRGR